MRLDDVLLQLENLSETEAEDALSAARTDNAYRLQCAGLFFATLVAISLFSLAVPYVFQAFLTPVYLRLVFAVLTLLGVWKAAKLLRRLVQYFYSRAITRQLKMRASAP